MRILSVESSRRGHSFAAELGYRLRLRQTIQNENEYCYFMWQLFDERTNFLMEYKVAAPPVRKKNR